MRRTTPFVLAAAGVFLASALAPARQDRPAAPSTVRDVMTSMTIPASDAIFETASEPPASDEKWGALRKAAETLAASGRLLTRAELARDKTMWMEMARALVNEAEATLKVAQAKNGDALAQASDNVYTTCENCHARYLEEPTKEPEPPR